MPKNYRIDDTSFIIPRLRKEDGGIYRCLVETINGNTHMSTVELKVGGWWMQKIYTILHFWRLCANLWRSDRIGSNSTGTWWMATFTGGIICTTNVSGRHYLSCRIESRSRKPASTFPQYCTKTWTCCLHVRYRQRCRQNSEQRSGSDGRVDKNPGQEQSKSRYRYFNFIKNKLFQSHWM